MTWEKRTNLHQYSNQGVTKPMRCRPCETHFGASQGLLCPFMPSTILISNYGQLPSLALRNSIYVA